MSKVLAKCLKTLLIAGILLINTNLASQDLQKPELGFGDACNRSGNTDFNLTFRYTTTPFNADNQFIVELSDSDGVFADPAPNLATIVNQNANFNQIPVTFQLPEGTFGEGFRVRIRATSPAMVSPVSDAFAAYDMVDVGSLWINDNAATETICGSGGANLKLNTDNEGVYEWYRNRTILVATTTLPELNVTEAGTYEAKVNYGACGYVESFLINVVIIDTTNAQIEGSSPVEICAEEAHTFTATVDNPAFTYNWYKDGTLVSTSNSHTYTTPDDGGQFGTYQLEIVSSGCSARSQEVVLQQKATASFTITNQLPIKTVYLPGEDRELTVTIEPSTATIASIVWFRNGEEIIGRTGATIVARQPGEYVARVTETGGACSFSLDSEPFILLETTSLNTEIRTATDYEECKSASTKLLIVGITATGEDGNTYDLTDKQLEALTYQWYKDDTVIPGQTQKELDVASYLENGMYDLEVIAGPSLSNKSNKLDVKLTIEDPEITSTSSSNSLCDGGTITYTFPEVITGFTYTWFKDGTELTLVDPKMLEVTEVGEYILRIEGFGCSRDLGPINVIPFDDSAVQITPSEKVVLVLGGFTTVTASGANSYEWYDDATGDLLSSNETLEVNKIGFYTLVATVDNCEVRKTIEVVEQDDQIIVPNIISPNTQDGINDTWEISNRYSFQPTVTIAIYNANGTEVYNTTEYKNDWPNNEVELGNQRIFYYKIIRDSQLIKAGSISVID
ncbi:gliding motility-associated C-terminal domain-containing protein [Tenacibaculum sp. 190524A02b]|uniref:T9SS type B sorting domain-containing protein n=1 Tax=Tenacibaculum vairaonense TaxID=3137860 RepID=UPI0031FA611D